MLRIQNISKSFGGQGLFEDASLQMQSGERLGLVGRNGHGKSTLFRIILGEEEADSGIITTPKNYRIGHLAQHIHFTRPTVLEEGILGLTEEEQFDHYKVERVLFGLGFTKEDMEQNPYKLSGGYQVRLNLAKVLVSNPNLLLLDEPTNYLDIVSVRWITGFLRAWKNELIIISHDRDFMDSVTTHTAMIHRQTIRKIEGNTQKLYDQIALEEEICEKTRINEEKQRKHIESFVNRFRAQATKASAVQSRVKLLEKMSSKEKLERIASLEFSFHYAPIEAKRLLSAANISFHFKPEQPLISNFNLDVESTDRIGIIGKNGKGKTTLLNVLSGYLSPHSGEIKKHDKMQLGYFGQTNIDRLTHSLTVEEEISSANHNLNRTAVRTIAGTMMFSGDQAEKRISVLSGGEKSRVLLGKILSAPANLLFLDEPTNHLDMHSIDALVESIQAFEGAVMIVTHSEMILRQVATKLIVFQHDGIGMFNGTYDEFLEKIGWDEEGVAAKSKVSAAPIMPTVQTMPPAEKGQNKKELRQKRSQLISDKGAALKPLKGEMELLEREICGLEEELSRANQQLAEASAIQDIECFVTVSKSIKTFHSQIEKKFERLAEITSKHDKKESEFNSLIDELCD